MNEINSRLFFSVSAVPQCSTNSDCRTSEICHTGSCINACLIFKCGANAICSTTVHDIACTCRPGFTGNGRDGCIQRKYLHSTTEPVSWKKMHGKLNTIFPCYLVAPTVVEPITPGCTTNSDCPDYTACRNTQCMNPCAVDEPCAPTANCKVINHQPVCTCPDGYIGSPTTECRLRKKL